MVRRSGVTLDIRRDLIQPKAEGEIAFRLSRNLQGPGVTAAQVLGATDSLAACFEIVDSRIVDWRIRIQDTVADNASCGLIVLGDTWVAPNTVDLPTCRMIVEHNGKEAATGSGAAALGSPQTLWLGLRIRFRVWAHRFGPGRSSFRVHWCRYCPFRPAITYACAWKASAKHKSVSPDGDGCTAGNSLGTVVQGQERVC